MLRRAVFILLAPLLALFALAGCDGDPIDYSGARYDIVLTWISGDSLFGAPGVYGSLGVAAAANTPGARHGALRWQDGAGNFWLFGGRGFDTGTATGRLHDLWKFNEASQQWTWVGGPAVIGGTVTHSGAGVYGVQGVAAAGNLPGARQDAVTWSSGGLFWLFGGQGYDSLGSAGRLADLWRYDPASNLWTWVAGSEFVDAAGVYGTRGTADALNHPGGRYLATGWTDTGGLLLFGGSGLDSGGACCSLNDLWRYDIASGQWTWLTGSDLRDGAATFGTAGAPAAANTPSGRFGAVSVRDSTGVAWLYGGTANDAAGARYVSAELWKYTSTGWAWVSGTQSAYSAAVHNGRGVPDLTSTPGSRTRATAWIDADNALWLFAGETEPANGTQIAPNDLWRYEAVAWTWMGGSQGSELSGRYSSHGGTGQPGSRAGSAAWVGSDGKLWLFGGDVLSNERNDLWYYAP